MPRIPLNAVRRHQEHPTTLLAGVVDVELHPAIVTKQAPWTMRNLTESPWLRLVRADQVKAGDLMVGSFWRAGNPLVTVDYFTAPYPADPAPFDPTCGCGVCGEQPYPAEGGVTLSLLPWNACDPFAVDDLVLILPGRQAASISGIRTH